ncbi:hypothetical protein M2283_009061 [Streptomyces pseudovenezuelae]|uniref:Uncharacterized protein n=1 Tax=Streptomyces pseudovenezuelae TaxID=67350 RepID=A0ABT6M228_9ACTN|nr:hypothetical protein [Streptomyces pseudovenezuelae]
MPLTAQELDLAGFEAQTLDDEPDVDPDWAGDVDFL